MVSDQTTQTDDYVNWQPIAARLGIRERAFWKLVHEDGLPYYRINNRLFRFRQSDVDQWLMERRKGGF